MSKPIGLTAKDSDGYHVFKIPNDCPFSIMKNVDGYIRTHRLMMAEYLQRPMSDKEVVHHINGIRDDNRIENLILLKGQNEHVALHNKVTKIGTHWSKETRQKISEIKLKNKIIREGKLNVRERG